MFKTFLKWAIGIGLLAIVIIALFAYYFNYSDGFRVGTLQKFSHKGFLFKTWEGQIDMGYLSNTQGNDVSATSNVATRIWNFSVLGKDEQVRHQIDSAIASGKTMVKLYYKEKIWQFFFWGETKYFVYRVEPIGK